MAHCIHLVKLFVAILDLNKLAIDPLDLGKRPQSIAVLAQSHTVENREVAISRFQIKKAHDVIGQWALGEATRRMFVFVFGASVTNK